MPRRGNLSHWRKYFETLISKTPLKVLKVFSLLSLPVSHNTHGANGYPAFLACSC